MPDGRTAAPEKRSLLGEFAFATFVIAFVAWYFLDAWVTSQSVENLVLILPVSGLCLLLYLVIIVDLLRRHRTAAAADPPREEPNAAVEEGRRDRRAVGLMGLTCVYVAAIAYLPFDVSTVAYLAAALWLNGERRWPFVGLYSLSFGLFVVLGFQAMLSIPFPTLLPFEP